MNKEKRDLLVFGYGLSFILIFIAWRLMKHHGPTTANLSLLIMSAFMLVITIIRLPALKTIYKYWMKGAHFIGNVITGIILSILFYFIFTPAGIIARILRKDLLDEKIEPKRDSYWIRRKQEEFQKEHFLRQF